MLNSTLDEDLQQALQLFDPKLTAIRYNKFTVFEHLWRTSGIQLVYTTSLYRFDFKPDILSEIKRISFILKLILQVK